MLRRRWREELRLARPEDRLREGNLVSVVGAPEVLGKLGRTGPLGWHLSYSGNLLLRQFGLVLFFAGVGTRSGHAFFSTLTESGGAAIHSTC